MRIAFFIFFIFVSLSHAEAQKNDVVARDQIKDFETKYNEIIGQFSRGDRQLKSWPYRRQKIVSDLLDSGSESTREKIVGYLCDTPATNWPSDFDNLLVQELIRRLSATNDLVHLKSLLAARCPEYLGVRPTEFWLVNERGPDAINVLASAYFLSGTNFPSQMLLACFRRAFPLLKSSNLSDSAFIDACVHWTEQNRARLKLNYDYYVPDASEPMHGALFEVSN
jgi:hypothetical protein